MATSKEYAYFIKGNKIAIVERDTSDSSGLTSPSAQPDIDLPNSFAKWKSPQSTVANGLELEYVYSPEYRINQIATTVACDRYTNSNGLLKIVDAGDGLPTSGVTHIVIGESERWNGLHKVNTLNAGYTILETKYNGGSVTEAFTVYTDVDVLNDESDVIDVASYLTKALVYYVKARIAEDTGQMDGKEYFMREFRVMLGKHENARIWGPRMISAGPYAIK
jgi:hypothetical protein